VAGWPGDDGYAHLMETLATGINPRLTVIGFYDNGSLGDKAIVAMGHAAAQGHLQKLEKTDLSTCCFGDEGLMALCEAEKQTHAFPKLQELRIAFNFITDKGFLALADVFAAGGFPGLVLLDATMNSKTTATGKEAVLASCKGRPFVPAV